MSQTHLHRENNDPEIQANDPSTYAWFLCGKALEFNGSYFEVACLCCWNGVLICLAQFPLCKVGYLKSLLCSVTSSSVWSKVTHCKVQSFLFCGHLVYNVSICVCIKTVFMSLPECVFPRTASNEQWKLFSADTQSILSSATKSRQNKNKLVSFWDW